VEYREWDLAISPQSLVDQIDEAGCAWGLRGEYDPEAQRVFVCEVMPAADCSGGLGDSGGQHLRRLCSVDDAHPFSAVLANRIHALELVGAQRQRMVRHDETQQKIKDNESEAHAHQWKAATNLRRRGGAIFWGGMNEELEQYRRAKRVRDEMRRRGMI
jgi:hypothetical protein